MAMAILTSRPNSHPFEERKVILTEAVKVGRSVAKSRPSQNNCIFDCKVLSRNHAILGFEDGKFFLRDTKSSNGTFVNNVRLSKGSEESDPRELKSGDIIQFGVDVVENSKKVTHGCIIANITLFLPDGKEATKSSSASRSSYSVGETGLQAQELWQISQYLQDALFREQMLENKLAALQRLISNSQTILDENSQKFAQEDKLLSRLETLENQVEALTRNLSEDDIKRQLLTLQEDRHNYEMRSKESLKRMLQEKLEAVQKLSEAERSCSNAEDECLHFKSLYEKSQQEMRELSDRHAQRLQEMKTLQEQVEEAERRHATVDEQATQERREFEIKLDDARSQEASLAARAESLQAECDFTKQQLSAMKAHLAKTRESVNKSSDGMADTTINPLNDSDGEEANGNTIVSSRAPALGNEPELLQENGELLNNPGAEYSSTDDVKLLQVQLSKLESAVALKEKSLNALQAELNETRTLLHESQEEVANLKDAMSLREHQLHEDKSRIKELEEQVMEYHLKSVDDLSLTDGLDNEDGTGVSENPPKIKRQISSHSRLQALLDKILDVRALVKERKKLLLRWAESEEGRHPKVNEEDVMVNSEHTNDHNDDPDSLVTNGLESIQEIEDNFADIEKLIDAEHEGGIQLKDNILEEQVQSRKKEEYVAMLKREVSDLTHERDMMKLEKTCEQQAVESAQHAAREMQKQAAKSAEKAGKNMVELNVVTEDNTTLKQRIQTLESELKKHRRENNRLSSDHSKLQSSYVELETHNRVQHEKLIKQQRIHRENEAPQQGISPDKASALEERLKSTEELLKQQQEDSLSTVQLEQERINKLQSYLLSLLIGVFALILAYALDLISIKPGGRLSFW